MCEGRVSGIDAHTLYFFPAFMDIFRSIKLSMCLLPSPIPCLLLYLDSRRLRGVRTFRPEPLRLIRLSWTWILSTQIPKTNTICRQSPSYITKLKFRNVITTLARLTVSIKQDFRNWYWLWKKNRRVKNQTAAHAQWSATGPLSFNFFRHLHNHLNCWH